MALKIGKYTYIKASDLLIILNKPPRTEKELKIFCFLIGIYSCRMFGVVRYRRKTGFDTDKIKIGVALNDCRTDNFICSKKKCNEPIHEHGLCFKHYCISEEQTQV